jgi:hypothetical protein
MLDALIESRHARGMIGERNTAKTRLFWLIAATWLATAIPILVLSLLLLEVPLWPSFSAESTAEGISVWTVVAAWFYITPVVLITVARRYRRRSAF